MDEVLTDNRNVASRIAAIMSTNKFRHNSSQLQMESNISETLEVARQSSVSAEQSWKGKVVEILKTDVFQRTAENPENILEHALSVAAQLAQQERESRLPKEIALIDTFCKRVRKQLLLGEAVDSLAFNQLDIYVPEKPVRAFGRNRLSDTASKVIAQETQTKFGADQKVSDASPKSQMIRPHQVSSSLLNIKNMQKQHIVVDPRKVGYFESNQQYHQHENRSLSVSKISTNDLLPTKFRALPLARVSTPVIQHDVLDSNLAASYEPDLNSQSDMHSVSRQSSLDQIKLDSNEESHIFTKSIHHHGHPALNIETRCANNSSYKIVPKLSEKKCILHEYLREAVRNPKLEIQTGKSLDSSISSRFSASKFQSSSKALSANISNKISDKNNQLYLQGESKTTHSVTEFGAISRWQNMQASHSIRTSQYRPILMKPESITPFSDDYAKHKHRSFTTYCNSTTLQDPKHAFVAELRLTLSPHSLEHHKSNSFSNVGKSSSCKPKSRGYSSHGTPGLAFDSLAFPPVNVVLNQNSPSSSKPQTPHLKPWSPSDFMSPSRPASVKKSAGYQPHITGIALDDGDSINDFELPLM